MPEIEQTVRSWYIGTYGMRDPRVSLRRHFDDRFAWLFRNHPIYFVNVVDNVTNATAESVLKIRESADSARAEFETLRVLTRHFEKSDNRFSVPTPIAILPDLSGLLMSRVAGRRLDKILWHTPGFTFGKEGRSEAIEGIRNAAVWLANFQKEDYYLSPRSLSVDNLRRELQSTIELCRGLLEPDVIDAIEEWSKRVFDISWKFNCQCVPICPNFVPHHVFISDGRTSVVDFESQECGWPGSDLASFLVYVEFHDTLFQVLTPDEIRGEFLAAYASEAEFGPYHRLSLEVSYVMNLLDLFRPLKWPDTTNSAKPSWIAARYARWKSRSAHKKLIDKTNTGTWKEVITDS